MYKDIEKNVCTKFIGKNIYYYETIDSTQKEAWRQINIIPNGSVIISNFQTSGIGTHGRIWYTTQENNIAFSIVLYPNVEVNRLEGITIKIAEIILEIFRKQYNINLKIKYPNDIMINNQKVGGILTETKILDKIVKGLVIGIGLNTNNCEISTSIRKEFNIQIDNEKIISEFCNKFEELYLKNVVIRKEK